MYVADTFGEKVKFEIKTNETQADSTSTAAFENFEQNIEKIDKNVGKKGFENSFYAQN